jgi:hypothetical protein
MTFAAAVWMLTSAAATTAAPSYPDAKTLLDSIAQLEKSDPGSPGALEGRLEYVDLILSTATGDDCQRRLDDAQLQLDTVAADPSFEVLVPAALARRADVEYRIHSARAECGSEPAKRSSELHQALAAAQRAVGLYRDALDYQSMAVLQFSIASTQRLLGNDAAAVAELRAALDMDREFGFREDAEDNYALLAQWTGKASETDALKDFPSRTATLKFGWSICNAQVAVEVNYARVFEGSVLRYRGHTSFKRTYREGHFSSWQVAQEPGQVSFDGVEWPQDLGVLRELAVVLERALAEVPDIDVNKEGEFSRARDTDRLSTRLTRDTEALLTQHGPTQPHPTRLQSALAHDMRLVFNSEALQERAAERHGFETEAWVGATLEQGVWYKMSAPLAMPGVLPISLAQDVEFAFTHQVPCKADSTDRSCVELVVRATPQADAVSDLVEAMDAHYKVKAHYWSSTYMRIVTDPNTLLIRVRDMRQYWHTSLEGVAGPDGIQNASQRLLATSDY